MDVFCTVIDIISVCGSIPIEIPILWPRAVMVSPRPRVLLTLPLVLYQLRKTDAYGALAELQLTRENRSRLLGENPTLAALTIINPRPL